MPTISVITPVYEGGHRHLGEAYRSLVEQPLPEGWSWQWIVQEDGRSGKPASCLPADPRISAGSGRRGGAAIARTMALARATGTLIRALDADDLLPVGTLARDIETLQANPELGWCVSPCLDLLPDGTLVPGPYDPPPGPLPQGLLAEGFAAGKLPVMGTTLTAHADLVRAVGGWPALPAYEDVALLLACEAVAAGWMNAEAGEIYRKHPRQSTKFSAYRDPDEIAARTASILARTETLRRSRWQWAPSRMSVQAECCKC
ncbi:glycosyltransferase family 2 protein [Actinomadura scrupuli]|uniref:glycosyltransferase family 2 protein n=1 Tax=Actinomadura scrupuli TaxID=559629 RepID=UPI003D99674F